MDPANTERTPPPPEVLSKRVRIHMRPVERHGTEVSSHHTAQRLWPRRGPDVVGCLLFSVALSEDKDKGTLRAASRPADPCSPPPPPPPHTECTPPPTDQKAQQELFGWGAGVAGAVGDN